MTNSTGAPDIATPHPHPLPGRLPTEPEAIFIVGVPRSGTTMMRELLERSPRIAIARETHFIGHVREGEGARFYFRRAGDLANDATLERIVDWIYTGEFQRQSRMREISPFWRLLERHIPRADVLAHLLAAPRTERDMFAAFLRSYADFLNRPLIGEKTPAHLAYVDTLFEWFPEAKVIHMLRDPRAVYVSDLRRRRRHPRRPYSWLMKLPLLLQTVLVAQTVLGWRAAARYHDRYQHAYPERYRMVRFEDVLLQPETKVAEVFAFLGVEQPADAIEVRVVSHGVNRGREGLDSDAAERWRTSIHPLARRLLETFTGGPMRRLGYGR